MTNEYDCKKCGNPLVEGEKQYCNSCIKKEIISNIMVEDKEFTQEQYNN